ncbi:MAG: general secretion pathway protein GspK [Synergistaceae bacterium]|jgi:hypothetical protein|nr:general secretion pathway protein GspK [Synergistaceae bacterium]
MFISTILLSAAVSFAWFARQEMRRISGEEFAMKSRSLVDIVCLTVAEWIAGDDNEYDSDLELLYSGEFPLALSFDEWDVGIKITPLDRQFSINGIFLPDGVTMKKEYEYPWQEIWRRLGDERAAPVVLDFLDSDELARPGGREEDYFLNRKLSDMSELLHIKEIKPGLLYEGLAGRHLAIDSFFTVYADDKININLASRETLSVLDEQITPGVVDAILAYRREANISNAKDLIKIPAFPVSAVARLNNIIGYKSNYFSVDMKVEYNSDERNFNVVMKRSGNGCQIIGWRE